MENIGPTFIAVIGGIITLAIVAVLVAKKAQTPAVITSIGSALSGVITAAVGPVANSQNNNFGG
jgi:drug/metabolite transporter (DMT)-like permease